MPEDVISGSERNPFKNSLNDTSRQALSGTVSKVTEDLVDSRISQRITEKTLQNKVLRNSSKTILKNVIPLGLDVFVDFGIEMEKIQEEFRKLGNYTEEEVDREIEERLKAANLWKELPKQEVMNIRSANGGYSSSLYDEVPVKEKKLNQELIKRYKELYFQEKTDGSNTYTDKELQRLIEIKRFTGEIIRKNDTDLATMDLEKIRHDYYSRSQNALERELTPGEIKNADATFEQTIGKRHQDARLRLQGVKTATVEKFMQDSGVDINEKRLKSLFEEMKTGDYEYGYQKVLALQKLRGKNNGNIIPDEEESMLQELSKKQKSDKQEKNQKQADKRESILNLLKQRGTEQRENYERRLKKSKIVPSQPLPPFAPYHVIEQQKRERQLKKEKLKSQTKASNIVSSPDGVGDLGKKNENELLSNFPMLSGTVSSREINLPDPDKDRGEVLNAIYRPNRLEDNKANLSAWNKDQREVRNAIHFLNPLEDNKFNLGETIPWSLPAGGTLPYAPLVPDSSVENSGNLSAVLFELTAIRELLRDGLPDRRS